MNVDASTVLTIFSSNNRSKKAQSIEIAHRPQFAEGLPMFPIRHDKKIKSMLCTLLFCFVGVSQADPLHLDRG